MRRSTWRFGALAAVSMLSFVVSGGCLARPRTADRPVAPERLVDVEGNFTQSAPLRERDYEYRDDLDDWAVPLLVADPVETSDRNDDEADRTIRRQR